MIFSASNDIFGVDMAEKLGNDARMSTVTTREVLLYIDGGPSRRLPVRCCGYVENGAFTIEEVWLDVPEIHGFRTKAYNIVENLKPIVLEALEREAEEQIMWEGP